jgi:hypothetical protein
MTEIYARDLNPNILNDQCMGKGFEKLLKEAEEQDCDVIVGHFTKPHLERYSGINRKAISKPKTDFFDLIRG